MAALRGLVRHQCVEHPQGRRVLSDAGESPGQAQLLLHRKQRNHVACYDEPDAGHFNAHRDYTTRGTAHRRFAVSINLNAGFEGGEIGFPEYGSRTFKPVPGTALVFSCSLLHAVTPVTRGRRLAFLPFLYDDAAAQVREANNAFLADGL
ncbi:MAG: 2OG-Fe(II) oxygenase [Burkholderiales bacterium]